MKIYSLRELFELRNVESLKSRQAFGRFFFKNNAPGLMDASGVVWPVVIRGCDDFSGLHEGCVYRISSVAADMRLSNLQRSDLESDFLLVDKLELVSGEKDAQWTLPMIPDPGFCAFPENLVLKKSGSHFFHSMTSARQTKLAQRSKVMSDVRRFFSNSGYLEFDPPTLVVSGGVERYLNVFCTQYVDHRGQNWAMQLPTSPELSLKKLISEGTGRLFALTHAFRNQGELSAHHDPEFLMLEWYRISEDFESLLDETQKVVEKIAESIVPAWSLPRKKWPRFSVESLFKDLLKMDLESLDDLETFKERAAEKSYSIVATDTWDDVFCKLFMEFVEPFLKEQVACFVTHYPAKMGALAALNLVNFKYVDRFELYLSGVEICNGYRELIDCADFRKRVETVQVERVDLAVDPQFESCFARGLYPCVGNALGLDRLIGVFMGAQFIQDTLPWPFASRFGAKTIALE